jgi:hypothetical protein
MAGLPTMPTRHLGDLALAAAMEPINSWCDHLDTPHWSKLAELTNGYMTPRHRRGHRGPRTSGQRCG